MTGFPERSKPSPGPMHRWHINLGLAPLMMVTVGYGIRIRFKRLLRDLTERFLRTHFASQVVFSDFDMCSFPRVRVKINRRMLKHKGRTDAPPLIQARKVPISGNLTTLFRAEPRIALVQLEGLEIHIPPRQPGDEPLIRGKDQDLHKKYLALFEEIRAD